MTLVDAGGLHVELRLIVSRDAEQRFDADGTEVLQLRGKVVDAHVKHPECVVRFRGQQRVQLARWARPGQHLVVTGRLEVKTWPVNGKTGVALLVEAHDIHPLTPAEPDNSRAGVRGQPGTPAPARVSAPAGEMAGRAALMRRMLERD